MRAPATAALDADRALPTPGRYEIDPVHSLVGFVARHLVVTKVRGRFTAFSGTITVAEPVERSHVEVEIRAESIATGIAARDAHLRSADYFDAAMHPVITFRSTGVAERGQGAWVLTGDLTIRGIARPVSLDVALLGTRTSSSGAPLVTLQATTEVQREDFGLAGEGAAPTGDVLIGHTVLIELLVQAVAVDR